MCVAFALTLPTVKMCQAINLKPAKLILQNILLCIQNKLETFLLLVYLFMAHPKEELQRHFI